MDTQPVATIASSLPQSPPPLTRMEAIQKELDSYHTPFMATIVDFLRFVGPLKPVWPF